jgi:hypothetical protein
MHKITFKKDKPLKRHVSGMHCWFINIDCKRIKMIIYRLHGDDYYRILDFRIIDTGEMVEYDFESGWKNILDAKRVIMDYLCRK